MREQYGTIQNAPDHEAESLILKAVRSIRYGSVEIVIHDSRVVQVERREKHRFTASHE
ncbi:MAG: YezD family protein [Candidatus Hydrogenedentes bacterium]|nr:YezD family protein [Candidatus Hydrogenedentota bacterium]